MNCLHTTILLNVKSISSCSLLLSVLTVCLLVVIFCYLIQASASYYFISEMFLSRLSNLFCTLQKLFESGLPRRERYLAALFNMSQSYFCITCSSSIINLHFHFSVEVGVRVEAYNCEEWIKNHARHINSAFLIFNAVNDNGELLTLPRIKPTTQVSSHPQE